MLSDAYTFKNGLVAKNRLVMAPMTLGACDEGNYVSDEELIYFQRRSKNVGIIITGCAYVDELGQAFTNSYSVAEDDKIESLSKLAKSIKSGGALAILQIYHGGRMVFPDNIPGGIPVGPSAVKGLRSFTVVPRVLSHVEVMEMVQKFLKAIERAIEAGFDGVELHGANTYLIQQFVSPHSNIRRDKWGGSFNNRIRFAKTLVKEGKKLIREKANRPFLLGYRFSPEEIEEPGITLFDTLQLLDQLIKNGVDYLHASMKDVYRKSMRNELNNTPIIHSIIKQINNRVPFIAVGNINTKAKAEEVLSLGIPFVSVGKALLLEPDFLIKDDSQMNTVFNDELNKDLKLPHKFVEELRGYLEGEY